MGLSQEEWEAMKAGMKSERVKTLASGIGRKTTQPVAIRPPNEEPAKEMILELPYPPSMNSIWGISTWIVNGRSHGKIILTKPARLYTKAVGQYFLLNPQPKKFSPDQRLSIRIEVYPPDRRRRDLGNIEKLPLDCLQKFGIIPDDEQVDKLELERFQIIKGGAIKLIIKSLSEIED